jgi:hypothetical protein
MSLKVLALNCTLKPSPARSSTERLLTELLAAFGEYAADGDIVRVADLDIIKPSISSFIFLLTRRVSSDSNVA